MRSAVIGFIRTSQIVERGPTWFIIPGLPKFYNFSISWLCLKLHKNIFTWGTSFFSVKKYFLTVSAALELINLFCPLHAQHSFDWHNSNFLFNWVHCPLLSSSLFMNINFYCLIAGLCRYTTFGFMALYKYWAPLHLMADIIKVFE